MSKLARVAFALLLAGAHTATANSTFFDGTFSDSDWQVSLVQSGNGGTVTGVQVATGGDPGAYRRVVDAVNSYSPSYTSVLGFHQRLGATYDPSSGGAISSIDFAIDYLNISGFGGGQAFGLSILQNGVLYDPLSDGTFTVAGWQHVSHIGLTAAEFGKVLPAGRDITQHPDFSATGAPIAFGFVTANSTTDVPYTITVGYDNWNVTIHSVPEPASIVVAGLAGLALVARALPRTRRKHLKYVFR